MTRRAPGEGSIYRRKDGRWVGQAHKDTGGRSFVYGRTQREVREQLTVINRDLQQGIAPITGRIALARYLKAGWSMPPSQRCGHRPSCRTERSSANI